MANTQRGGGALAIAAHPDDEVLGCGGVLALHARAGDPVTAVIVCEGETIRLTDLIRPLEGIVREVRPRVVYCQYGGDVNRDHQILFKAVLVATRPTEAYLDAVYAFDTASSTEWAFPRSFAPDTWVDISATLAAKL